MELLSGIKAIVKYTHKFYGHRIWFSSINDHFLNIHRFLCYFIKEFFCMLQIQIDKLLNFSEFLREIT